MIRQEIIDRVLARRGRVHLFDRLQAKKTALLVIDMQNAFVAPGAPIEVPAAREIVPSINRLAAELRKRGVPVVWVLHENPGGQSWTEFFDRFIRPENARAAAAALSAGHELQKPWRELEVSSGDVKVAKNRYSAFIGDSSPLNGVLRERGIDTVLIAGTMTNVCCEASARDAMAAGFKTIVVGDANAAQSEGEHVASLSTIAQFIGDVRNTDEVIQLLR